MYMYLCDKVENILRKGENSGYGHFLLFPQYFPKAHFLVQLRDHCVRKGNINFSFRADDLAAKFCYDVTYSGVGQPPKGSEHLGFCSQIAVLTLCPLSEKPLSSIPVTQTYKLVSVLHSFL